MASVVAEASPEAHNSSIPESQTRYMFVRDRSSDVSSLVEALLPLLSSKVDYESQKAQRGLEDIIFHVTKLKRKEEDDGIVFRGLHDALAEFSAHVRKVTKDDQYDFMTHTLPSVLRWSLEHAEHAEMGILLQQKVESVTVSQQHARYILANAFILNLTSIGQPKAAQESKDDVSGDVRYDGFGEVDYLRLYYSRSTVGVQRIICQLAYFYQCERGLIPVSAKKTLSFERHVLQSEPKVFGKKSSDQPPGTSSASGSIQAPDWSQCTQEFTQGRVQVHSEAMETPPSKTFVDFANKQIHIGQIIPSMTQEEVLFSVCPEAFLSMLVCQRLQDNEIVMIRGLRRFSDYNGYLHSFRFAGLHKPPSQDWQFDSLVIDSVEHSHFRPLALTRDLNKAFLGFQACAGGKESISTGNWGCGAFGGDKTLKFLQQLMAAEVSDRRLMYSTYKDHAQMDHAKGLLKMCIDNHWTVADVYKLLHTYATGSGSQSFATYAEEHLKQAPSSSQDAVYCSVN